jgi:hypothetical protein
MKALIPVCALALAFGISASAQDTTTRSKTKIEVDDARAVMLNGCLQRGANAKSFVLVGTMSATAEEIRSKTKVETDVDDGNVETRTKTKVEADDGVAVGTGGAKTTFTLVPKEGVNLVPHVGHQVEIAALIFEPGAEDADVKIREKTKIEVEDAPDVKIRTKTKAELPRTAPGQFTAVSVKHIAPTCAEQ